MKKQPMIDPLVGAYLFRRVMMFKKMDESSGNIIGFSIIGNLEKSDYATLTNEVQGVIDEHGAARLLLDMQQYISEDASAWSANLKFSHTYHGKIEKLAVVGDQERHKHLASHAKFFYAQEAAYFSVFDRQSAWNWLNED